MSSLRKVSFWSAWHQCTQSLLILLHSGISTGVYVAHKHHVCPVESRQTSIPLLSQQFISSDHRWIITSKGTMQILPNQKTGFITRCQRLTVSPWNTMVVGESVRLGLLLLAFADFSKYQRGLLGAVFGCGGNVDFHPGGKDAETEHGWIDKGGQPEGEQW